MSIVSVAPRRRIAWNSGFYLARRIGRSDCTRNLRLLTHESVHAASVSDWEEKDFLQEEYIQQIAAEGYLNAPFELEAEAKAIRACRDAGVHPF